MLHEDVTGKIIQAFYKVYNTLGYGFLENVYSRAMVVELARMGLRVIQQMPIHVYYEGVNVGLYYADLCVEDKVIVELKAAETLAKAHEAQLLNYLRATSIEVGLVLNFGPQPNFVRKIYSNSRKTSFVEVSHDSA